MENIFIRIIFGAACPAYLIVACYIYKELRGKAWRITVTFVLVMSALEAAIRAIG